MAVVLAAYWYNTIRLYELVLHIFKPYFASFYTDYPKLIQYFNGDIQCSYPGTYMFRIHSFIDESTRVIIKYGTNKQLIGGITGTFILKLQSSTTITYEVYCTANSDLVKNNKSPCVTLLRIKD